MADRYQNVYGIERQLLAHIEHWTNKPGNRKISIYHVSLIPWYYAFLLPSLYLRSPGLECCGSSPCIQGMLFNKDPTETPLASWQLQTPTTSHFHKFLQFF